MLASTEAQRQRSVDVHRRFRRDHPTADVPLVVYSPAAVAPYLAAPPSAPGLATQVLPFELAAEDEGPYG